MSEDTKKDHDQEIVRRALDLLGEHFDNVHIFVNRHEGENEHTVGYQKGTGNWWARVAQIEEWVETQRERTRIKARQDEEDDQDDDD